MAGKSKIVEGALGALSDIFKKGEDKPVDEGRRKFLKSAPATAVGGAGALAGVGGGAAIIGAKALFGQGKFDDIIVKIKAAMEEMTNTGGDWEALEKSLDLTPNEIDSVLKNDTFAGDFLEDAVQYEPSKADLDKKFHGFDIPGSEGEHNFLRGEFDSLWYSSDLPDVTYYNEALGGPLFKYMAKKVAPDVDDKELLELQGWLF